MDNELGFKKYLLDRNKVDTLPSSLKYICTSLAIGYILGFGCIGLRCLDMITLSKCVEFISVIFVVKVLLLMTDIIVIRNMKFIGNIFKKVSSYSFILENYLFSRRLKSVTNNTLSI